ncbi:hypothetical protein HN371_19830 [Candidatus Poribacteria bacterium]|nr:hypothetical protein [Candidatus Poribacteria bacterium]MBT5532867.1 hypothetical protein [Candidatus Poribacteria bacterium]MBT5709874.1 hypothetical protein [Candidatus Poribacteria bacterium]MBT7804542.1 hypothetical protein [Candidatus Poribacteria bacterium]
MEAVRVALPRDLYVRAATFLDDVEPTNRKALLERKYRLAYELARDIAQELSSVHIDLDAPFLGPEGAD